MKAMITVIGKDNFGIISGTSTLLTQYNVNILDISQTILSSYFTMIMLVDLEKTDLSFVALKDKLTKKGEELGVSIQIQHEDIFKSMHKL